MEHDPTKVQRAIADAEFPATPDELAASAEARGAHPDICETLRSLPPEQYDDADAVMATIEDQIA
ncbi:DUF2795 domain-containing protein [Egibacter rhizosphaerae]|uniref:DUF2795 domain-containing protein n=1 Tax=Egibacter rhizosphaerae TaxID=1670831 RepID=A0A411YAY5_9ACTN|nr:DUF2795 domain-containing protein [Egibacter rhizosphaerae]QBI18338.1 DUF2795 domain-containing protein [Egibacter rhizosphaerae]